MRYRASITYQGVVTFLLAVPQGEERPALARSLEPAPHRHAGCSLLPGERVFVVATGAPLLRSFRLGALTPAPSLLLPAAGRKRRLGVKISEARASRR